MSNTLCTFSGKFGDILWSLPTVKQISIMRGEKVDFFMMPYYESLCELIARQSYVENCGVISDWVREHSNHGDQPWQPQNLEFENKYEKVYHLTFRGHPGISAPSMPLIDFIAWQQGIKLQEPIPFIEVENYPVTDEVPNPSVVMSFNEQYREMKDEFIEEFRRLTVGVGIIDMTTKSWSLAAWEAKHAVAYIGDRSSNWVIANGVGQNNIITYEPHQARHASGGLGKVFGNPYSKEFTLPLNMPPKPCADIAASVVKKIIENRLVYGV